MPLDKRLNQTSDNSMEAVVSAMLSPETYPHPCAPVITHYETHISHLFLTGKYVYKVKKPLALGFLDYSTLELRRQCCLKELRLNRRFAPRLYLALAVIVRADSSDNCIAPCRETGGESKARSAARVILLADAAVPDNTTSEQTVLEYAVCMQQFDNNLLFSTLAERGQLQADMLDLLVSQVAEFHHAAEPRPQAFDSAHLQQVMLENLETIRNRCSPQLSTTAEQAREVLLAELNQLQGAFVARLTRQSERLDSGRRSAIKLLHGDLHLGNVCVFEGMPTLFDCIEFNDLYAACDTWADIGFLIMDLFYRKLERFAWLVINLYAERSGDYDGLHLLPLYLAYRAGVRAKVRALYLAEHHRLGISADQELLAYLALACRSLDPARLANGGAEGSRAAAESIPRLWAVGGLSGSGKSTVARELSLQLGAIHLRSDVLRKHLSGLPLGQRAGEEQYTSAVSMQVYAKLIETARELIQCGYRVVCDATFINQSERERLLGVVEKERGFCGVWCECEPEIAERRIKQRSTDDPSDADIQVFRQQRQTNLGKIAWRKLSTDFELADLGIQVRDLIAMCE